MGWTFTTAKYWHRGKIDKKKECDELYTQDEHIYTSSDGKEYRYPTIKVLKSAMVGNTYYGAIEVSYPISNLKPTVVEGVVVLTSQDGYDFGYKNMSESYGPYHCDCPIRILDLLTPTTDENALAWRKKCRDNHAKVKLSKLPVGTTIEVTMLYNTTLFKKGDVVLLTKKGSPYQGGHSYWSNGWCKFPQYMMKDIERNGNYIIK